MSAFACKAKRFAIALLFVFLPRRDFRNIGEFGPKKYFTDQPAANTIQLVVSIKANFSHLLFF